jgi:ribulose-phosphate 3-epimerase
MDEGGKSMPGMISASMMCADFLHLAGDIRALCDSGVEYLHIDVMDGHFVPNFTLGPDYVRAVRSAATRPMDIHLMVERPARFIAAFEPRPGDIVSVHAQADAHLHRTLSMIRETGATPAVALNPAQPLWTLNDVLGDIDVVLLMTVNPGFAGQKMVSGALERIARMRKLADERHPGLLIEVDGNVSLTNARAMRAAGADIFVAGSSGLFTGGDIARAVAALREAIG